MQAEAIAYILPARAIPRGQRGRWTMSKTITHPNPDAVQEPDPRPGSRDRVSNDGAGDLYLMSGPYTSHAAALADVEPVRNLCVRKEARSCFMAFGTCRYPLGTNRPGSCQRLGLLPTPARATPSPRLTATCPECGRVFDLLNAADAAEWTAGHDCE